MYIQVVRRLVLLNYMCVMGTILVHAHTATYIKAVTVLRKN